MRQPKRWLDTLCLWTLLSACGERGPLAPGAGASPPPASLTRWECVASRRTLTLACGAADAHPGRAYIIGGQEQNVRLTTAQVSYDSASGVLRGDVTVRNLLQYPIATADGSTADSAGVKVFFHTPPVTTLGSGSVTVQNPDGIATFTAAGQPFFRYPGMLGYNQASSPRTWKFQLDPGVTEFAFTVLLAARIPTSAFRVLRPGDGEVLTGDTLYIVARPVDPAAIDSMRATVEYKTTPLAAADSGRWRGQIYVPGVSSNPLVLRVVAHAAADSTVVLVPFDDGGLEGLRRSARSRQEQEP